MSPLHFFKTKCTLNNVGNFTQLYLAHIPINFNTGMLLQQQIQIPLFLYLPLSENRIKFVQLIVCPLKTALYYSDRTPPIEY